MNGHAAPGRGLTGPMVPIDRRGLPTQATGMKARHWLLSGALAAAAVAVFLVVFVPPVGFNEMGACGEVTGSGCRPFVEAVYESLG